MRLERWILPVLMPAVWFLTGAGQAGKPVRGAVDYANDIRPIFERSCFACHGPDRQSGGLRLDSREAAIAGGVSGRVIVPGNGADSLLYRRIAGLGDEARMPLRGEKLSSARIAMIRAWIDSGSQWPEVASETSVPVRRHWAYVKPARTEPPDVRAVSWPHNAIDRFILSKLELEGLGPSPEASRETLIRRVSLDLVGLPPAPEEVAAFVADSSPDAYDKVVERLFASPRYGERWARPWLDLARYADTNGYEKDMRRSMWLYRDWVIDALNRDMPFDQFTIEQIAGDLLPNATVEQRIATGFHRNSMINEEGGIDPEEYRAAAVSDRVNTTGSVWLGSTIACAQCHDHKFDPFKQEEYYRLFAFFNGTEEEIRVSPGGGRFSLGPNLAVPAPRSMAPQRRQIEDQIALIESILGMSTPELRAQQARWEETTREILVRWEPVEAARVITVSGSTFSRLPDGSVLLTGRPPDRDTYLVAAQTKLTGIRAVRLEALADPSLPGGGVSRGTGGGFALTGFELEIAPAAPAGEFEPVLFSEAAARDGTGARGAIDDDPSTAWAYTAGGRAENAQIVFVAKAPFGFESGSRLRFRLKHESQAPQQTIGRFRLWLTDAGGAAKSVQVPVDIQSILAVPAAERTDETRKRAEAYYRSVSPLLDSMREWLDRLRRQWNELAQPATFVMKDLPEPRKTFVHVRGSFLSRGKEVTPGIPAVLSPLPKDPSPNRLTLARWLVDAENPLTARVAINRSWAQFFGRGIVETVDDFGTQGQAPSHPELLDWLATEFVRLKWSMKAMHRLIVTSATYRQDSRVSSMLLAKDPLNRLLARAPRPRLEAEAIRDSALAAAGLLSDRMGGPSVFPPQPEGIWNLVYNDDRWRVSDGEDRYRRGIYTFWRRTAPYPMFAAFDAPSREAACTRRIATDTPLQALNLLNDPVFVDAARGLARRIMAEGPPDEEEQLVFAFRLCLARAPEAGERERLLSLLRAELERFRSEPAKAGELAGGGEVRPASGTDVARFGAWTVVANVLLNLDEFVTRP